MFTRIVPAPLPRLRRFFSRTNCSAVGALLLALLLLLVAAAGSFYLHQPAALWDALLGGAGGLPENPTIAVLPFDDMSPTHDQQYLADGITEELIMRLAKFPTFVVMARTSAFAYKDKPTDVRKVGKDLNVRYVLRGQHTTRRSERARHGAIDRCNYGASDLG